MTVRPSAHNSFRLRLRATYDVVCNADIDVRLSHLGFYFLERSSHLMTDCPISENVSLAGQLIILIILISVSLILIKFALSPSMVLLPKLSVRPSPANKQDEMFI